MKVFLCAADSTGWSHAPAPDDRRPPRPRRTSPAPKLACPDAERHTPSPDDYLVWHAWAEDMDRTHRQQKCPGCGHWVIWVPR